MTEDGRILNQNPEFVDTTYHLLNNSPALHAEYEVAQPKRDFYGNVLLAIGAVGVYPLSVQSKTLNEPLIYPNPAQNLITLRFPNEEQGSDIRIVDLSGVVIWESSFLPEVLIDVNSWQAGAYLVKCGQYTKVFIKY